MDIKDLQDLEAKKTAASASNDEQSKNALNKIFTELKTTIYNFKKITKPFEASALQNLYHNNPTRNLNYFKNIFTDSYLTELREICSSPSLLTALNNFSMSRNLSQISLMHSLEMKELLDTIGKLRKSKYFLQHSPEFESLRSLNDFLNKDLYTRLANLQNSPFPSIENISSIIDIVDFDSENTSSSKLATEITDEILSVDDYNSLSPKVKNVLKNLFIYILLPYIISNLPSPTGIYLFLNEVSAFENTSQKTAARVYSQCIDQENTKYFRTITAHNVNFRKTPDMKSQIINTLPINKLIEVVDKDDKSWLLVKVNIDNEIIEGWVLRRYTDNLR